MIEALCKNLYEKPGFYLEDMVVFLWDEFQVMVKSLVSEKFYGKRLVWKNGIEM